MIANNPQRPPANEGDTRLDSDDTSGAATGIVAGGALGGAAGLAVSLMGLAIPGIGPILAAGPIAAMLAGAGAGAVAGGLIGGLTDLGVDGERGGVLRRSGAAWRRAGHGARGRVACRRGGAIIRRHGAFDIEDRVLQWKSTGWKGYNPKAEPFTFEEIERDRTTYRAGPAPGGMASEIGRMENT